MMRRLLLIGAGLSLLSSCASSSSDIGPATMDSNDLEYLSSEESRALGARVEIECTATVLSLP